MKPACDIAATHVAPAVLGLRVATVAVMLMLAAACADEPQDLKQYVEQVIARQKPRVEPIPKFKPLPVYVYDATELRDPFTGAAPGQEAEDAVALSGSGVQPPVRATTEPLEAFPLDTLRMVGTIGWSRDGVIWALVKDGEGTIHRVKVGNYMGKNYGKIMAISRAKLELVEIVPDGRGAYIERPSEIALSESAGALSGGQRQ